MARATALCVHRGPNSASRDKTPLRSGSPAFFAPAHTRRHGHEYPSQHASHIPAYSKVSVRGVTFRRSGPSAVHTTMSSILAPYRPAR